MAVSLVRQVFPRADVTAESNNGCSVSIHHVKSGTQVVSVPQRDLFSKYGWPAKSTIIERLEMFKEDFES